MKQDQQLHVICSAIMTVFFHKIKVNPIIPTLAIGTYVETVDYRQGKKDCCEDCIANLIGVGVGLMIIKLLK